MQVGVNGSSSHTYTIEHLMLRYNTAQPSTNTNANCLVLEGVDNATGPYWCNYENLYFYRGYYAFKTPSGGNVPWACRFDMLTMSEMSGGMVDQSGTSTMGGVNNVWGRATMHCDDAVGPIFKNWHMYGSTVDALEFLTAYEGASLMAVAAPFMCDFRSIRLENGTYAGAGVTRLLNFSGPHFVNIGIFDIGGQMSTFTPSGGGTVAIISSGNTATDDSYVHVGSMYLVAQTLSGNCVAVTGGSAANNRIKIGNIRMEDGWTLQYTGGSVTGDFTKVESWVNGSLSGDKGDADYTVKLGDANLVHFSTSFTAQRIITLPASSSNNNCAGLYYDLIFDGAINGTNTALIKHGSTTLRTQSVDKKRLRYVWRRGGSGSGQWVLTDISDLDPDVTQSLRADRAASGGGLIAVDSSGYASWSQRFIVIGGKSTSYAQEGFFNIECPTSGTIAGVGGAANKTATAAGIPLAAWESLYYILPIGQAATSVPGNFRVVGAASPPAIPQNWVLICTRNGESGVYNFPNGVNLRAGQSINVSNNIYASKVAVPATASTAARPGDWAADASYIYVYTGNGSTHSWVRSSAATW